MTTRLADLTPEQQKRQRATVRAYQDKTRDRRAIRHKERYASDLKYRAYKNAIAQKSHYKSKMGITYNDRDNAIVAQDYKCAICDKIKPLHTDHNHNTGKFRAMLCAGCNVFVGKIEKSKERHQRALAYLAKYNAFNI